MSDTTTPGAGKRPIPAFSFETFNNFLDEFPNPMPSHIDRSVFPGTMSGGNRSYILSTLRFFDLIDDAGIPGEDFVALVAADKAARSPIWHRLITDKYRFLLDNVDIERTTASKVADAFRTQGIGGDTVRKAVTFFLHAAKAANLRVSPHVKAPRSHLTRKPKAAASHNGMTDGRPAATYASPVVKRSAERTPYEILIDILTAEMTDEEQQAVWTLIRYLKKQDAQGE